MQKTYKIMTNDGNCFDSEEQAIKYLDNLYGSRLVKIAHQILTHNKYAPLLKYLDDNIEAFTELIVIKRELNKGIEDD